MQIHQGRQEEIQLNPELGNTSQKVYLTTLREEQMKNDPLIPTLEMREVEMTMGITMMRRMRMSMTDQNLGGQQIEGPHPQNVYIQNSTLKLPQPKNFTGLKSKVAE